MIRIKDNEKLVENNVNYSFKKNKSVIEFTEFNSCIVLEHHGDINELEIVMDEASNVELIEIFNEVKEDFSYVIKGEIKGHFSHTMLFLEKGKFNITNDINVLDGNEYKLTSIDLNDGDMTIKNTINLIDEHCICNLYCASVVEKDKKKLYTNQINNCKKFTKSYMENYGVSFDEGRLEIIGIGDIKKHASKSSSKQKSTMFVLDKTSKAISQPYLYIDEDDVEAAHASAVGQINDQAIFYLCSRGIKLEAARKMIVLGYFKPIVDKISDKEINDMVNETISKEISYV